MYLMYDPSLFAGSVTQRYLDICSQVLLTLLDYGAGPYVSDDDNNHEAGMFHKINHHDNGSSSSSSSSTRTLP